MKRRPLDIGRIEAFIVAAEELAFRRAAVRLGLDAPNVSRRIAALESELGVQLFERRSGGVRLTEVGRSFLVDARRIISDLERARTSIEAVAFGTDGRLRLGVCEDATTSVLAKMLANHRQRFPAVTLELLELPGFAQTAAIRRGEIDAGLLLPPVAQDGVQIEEIWRERWAVAVPSGHSLATASISVADVACFDFISAHPELGPGCHDQVEQLFTMAGVKPRSVIHAFHRQTMLMLVQSGAGITILPGSFIGVALDGIEFHALSTGSIKMVVAAAFPSGDVSGLVAQFLRVANETEGTTEHA